MDNNCWSNADCRTSGFKGSNRLEHANLLQTAQAASTPWDAAGAENSPWIQGTAWAIFCVRWRKSALCWVRWRRPAPWSLLLEWRTAGFVILFLIFGSTAAIAQDDAAFYRSNCGACHTIGNGPRVGPDLKGVTQRKDLQWLLEFMQDPKKVVDSGDPYAKNVVKASHGMVMPRVPGVDHERAEALLNFIDKESGSAQLDAGSAAAAARPIASEDISRGKALFIGRRALLNGGPACISCHTVSHVAPLGGGVLGPDLTQIVERLGGVSSIAAWLESPPTPTMRSTYNRRALRGDEVRALTAFLESAGAQTKAHAEVGGKWTATSFFLFGLIGSLGLLGLMELFWKNRFRAVRRPLVAKRRQQLW